MTASQPPLTSAPSRAKNVSRYFAVTPSPTDRTIALWFLMGGSSVLVAGAALMFANQTSGGLVGVLAGTALLIHGWSLMSIYRKRYTDAEPKPPGDYMDDLLESMLEKAGRRAMELLDITPAELELDAPEVRRARPSNAPRWLANTGDGPPTVFGPVINTRAQRIEWAPGAVWRFRSYNVLVLCPTRHRMGVYECTIDIGNGKISKQELREFFYSDVVAVNQMDKSEDLAMLGLDLDRRVTTVRWGKATLTQLEVVVASGDNCEIVGCPSWTSGAATKFQESGMECVVAAVRNLLRAKRPLPTGP